MGFIGGCGSSFKAWIRVPRVFSGFIGGLQTLQRVCKRFCKVCSNIIAGRAHRLLSSSFLRFRV